MADHTCQRINLTTNLAVYRPQFPGKCCNYGYCQDQISSQGNGISRVFHDWKYPRNPYHSTCTCISCGPNVQFRIGSEHFSCSKTSFHKSHTGVLHYLALHLKSMMRPTKEGPCEINGWLFST